MEEQTVQGQVPVQEAQVPEAASQESAPENHIPYSRFKEVIEQRNQLAAEMERVRAETTQSRDIQQPQSAGQFETVDDLIAYQNKELDRRLNEAYETRLKPLESHLENMAFSNTVEGYFASHPEKSELRGQMDAYTATLSPMEQQAIKQAVVNGNTRRLDEIFYAVKYESQANAQQMAQGAAQQQAQMATGPNPYRTVRVGEPSMQDLKAQAKETGDYTDVFMNAFTNG